MRGLNQKNGAPKNGARKNGAPENGGQTTGTPQAAVRAAIAEGVASRIAIARRTGLAPATVDAIIDHLERTGALRREQLASSCPASGCGGCAMAQGAGGSCPSGSAGEKGARRRGPIALVLTRR